MLRVTGTEFVTLFVIFTDEQLGIGGELCSCMVEFKHDIPSQVGLIKLQLRHSKKQKSCSSTMHFEVKNNCT